MSTASRIRHGAVGGAFPRTPTTALLALTLAACGSEVPDADAVAAPTWSLELVHQIGSIDDPAEMLTSVSFTDILLAEDGSLLVGQPQDAQVRVHDDAGAFVRTIGRRGEGPTEIGGLGSFGFTPEGDLWLHDNGNGRIHRYALNGTHLGAVPWPRQIERKGDLAYIWGMGSSLRVAPDGSALTTPGIAMPPRGDGPAPDFGPFVVRRMHPGGELGDTVLAMGRMMGSDAPEQMIAVLQTGLIAAPSRDGRRVHWVERSPLGNPEIGKIRVGAVGGDGDTLFIRTLTYEPVPTPQDELLREYLEARSERVRAQIQDRLWVPETYPPVDIVVPTTAGALWLERQEGTDPVAWWALDPATGEHVGTLELPEGERIRDQRGDVLVTSFQDEFDVPYLRRYRIRR